MTQKRIAVDDVKAAYRITKLRPCQRGFGNGISYGCPVMSLFVAAKTKCYPESRACRDWADEVYGKEYVSGFIGAVDMEHPPTGLEGKKMKAGWTDGTAVRMAIFVYEELEPDA